MPNQIRKITQFHPLLHSVQTSTHTDKVMSRVDIFTPLFKKEERYSDFTIGFNKNPQTGNLAKIVDEQAIKQHLKNLILTNFGERFYNQTYGSNIKALLFEQSGPDTEQLLKTIIQQAIVSNEPRVAIIDIQVEDDSDNNSYKVNLFFSVININDPLQLELTIKRVR